MRDVHTIIQGASTAFLRVVEGEHGIRTEDGRRFLDHIVVDINAEK